MFYIQIQHCPQKRLYPPWLSELTTITQLLMDVSGLLNIVTDSVHCIQTVSLLETTRLKSSLATDVISQLLFLSSGIYMMTNSGFLHESCLCSF